MSGALHQAALALALLAVLAAGLRIASVMVPFGLNQVIAAAVLAASIAVGECVLLGLVGLGSNSLVLVIGAALAYLTVAITVPAPETSAVTKFAACWNRMDAPWRVASGIAAGVFVGWSVWDLRHPSVGADNVIYHYTEVAGWIANGRPGSIRTWTYDIPIGNYPLTNEVLLTWAAGLARSFVPLTLWGSILLALLSTATWVTLRNLQVTARTAGLATAALVTVPLVVLQVNEPGTDLAGLTWLSCTAALATGAAASRRGANLLPAAVVAAGLAIGTKTTTAVGVAASLGVGVYLARARLRRLSGWLWVAFLVALGVGGVWYLRNLVEHGNPTWPFAAAPWGDPTPPFLKLVRTTFAQRPGPTLRLLWRSYGDQLGGGVVLLAGALLVLIAGLAGVRLAITQRKAVVTAASIAVIGLLAWTVAPGTGLPTAPVLLLPGAWPYSAVRYILPVLGAGTVAVALASRAGRVPAQVVTVVLAGAIGWSASRDAEMGFPHVPSAAVLLLSGGCGALVVVVLAALVRSGVSLGTSRSRISQTGLFVTLVVIGAVVLAPAGDGFVARYSQVKPSSSTIFGQPLAAWFVKQSWFEDSHVPIAFISRIVPGPIAGDHFTHPLSLISRNADCSEVRSIARRSVIVVTAQSYQQGLIGESPYYTALCLKSRTPDYHDMVYSIYMPPVS